MLIAIAVLSMLIKFLPVDTFFQIQSIFSEEEPTPYFKVVATEGSNSFIAITFIIGIALVIYVKYINRKNKG